jgi:3-oxoacyl-[acyl-carrier protein] reductase
MLGQTNYSAGQSGARGAHRGRVQRGGVPKVRINAIQTGFIRTAMTDAMPEHVKESKIADIPTGRAGEAGEFANVVVFLASDLSSYITGAALEISGARQV